MKEYKLLEATSAEEFSLKVTEALNNGYDTIGNIVITERLKLGYELTGGSNFNTNHKIVYYSQAVIKNISSPTKIR